MKLCIFGGTFDPIHNGHIHIANKALSEFNLDKVIFMPTGNSYMKSDVTPAIHRYNMLSSAVKDFPAFEISDMEIKRSGYTYTCDTVEILKEKYPDTQIFFLIGSDTLFMLEKWYKREYLFDNLIFIVADRNDETMKQKAEELKKNFNADIRFLNCGYYNISSTQIREYFSKNGYVYDDFISKHINEKEFEYIKENHLYVELNEKEMVEFLSKELKESRLIHTLGVMDTACRLAKVYNVDNKKAATAALLHDCAKYMDFDEKLAICERNFESLNDLEKKSDALLHAKAGAWYAYEKYGIKDKEILDAIKYHTTGRPDMSMLEKIIFISDFIEPSRTHSDKLPMYRMIASVDIDLVCMNILKDTLDYLESKNEEFDPMTLETYQFYKNLISSRDK